jgi:uncharacterized protein
MTAPRYSAYRQYLEARFGEKVKRLAINAGLGCPNRDGTLSDQGCVFCRPDSYAPEPGREPVSLAEQISGQMVRAKRKGYKKFIAYFQSYTNTYAPLDKLRNIYDSIRPFPEIVGMNIGTRPDCLTGEIVRLINSYADQYEVWVELGLQSAHDKTLQELNRGHGLPEFLQAVELLRKYPQIKIAAHVILGLPGETESQEQETAEVCRKLHLEGVKIHALYIAKETILARKYSEGKVSVLGREEYVRRVVRFLENLWPQTVIFRLSADCPAHMLLAPSWLLEKQKIIHGILDLLEKENTWQGKKAGKG